MLLRELRWGQRRVLVLAGVLLAIRVDHELFRDSCLHAGRLLRRLRDLGLGWLGWKLRCGRQLRRGWQLRLRRRRLLRGRALRRLERRKLRQLLGGLLLPAPKLPPAP